MKKIWLIYFRDLKNISGNWVAFVLILGLVILPSLYAWFNIKASWDPYGRTSGLQVAVVNRDAGATLQGKPLNIGDQIISALKENRKIGWTFVDEKQAMKGVEHGDYYASILIPADFSKKIATVLTDNPQKAELDYYVNEKINAIAPRITAKGASGIVEEINRTFIKVATETLFRIFNELGIELETQRPAIEKVRDLIFKLEALIPEINSIVNVASDDIRTLNELIRKAQANLPLLARLAQDGQDLANRVGQFLDRISEAFATISPNVKQDLALLQQTALAAEQVSAILQDVGTDPAALEVELDRSAERLAIAMKNTDNLVALFDRLNSLAGNHRLASMTGRLRQVSQNFQQQLSLVNNVHNVLKQGGRPADELINNLHRISEDSNRSIGDILQRYDSEIAPQIQQGVDQAKASVQNVDEVLAEASKRIPDVQRILNDASQGLAVGMQELQAIQSNLPAVEAGIKRLANLIRTLEKEGTLDQLIDLLKKDAKKESEFFTQPVVLKENKLFPIPNYGSAMSPFFTTLSLWVGALLLVSLLTVEVHDPNVEYKSYEIYFGRYLTFLTLADLQSLVVTTGDILIVQAYVADKMWFILFGMLLSSVFMFIVYTLVSVFGNVGKAMAILLLVLQIAGSGGTFPIQVTPQFFQVLYPFLPFTYAISMLREAVGGILWDIVGKDLFMLGVYVVITLMMGLALKKFINQATEGLVKKAKKSQLIH
ncbi:YhgE/Pip domain-containing protein [Effusibacillus pohliae]|uniref:YhgE/Pip domain-containing protein n=1 Tax=Effusibacillus pohliae TaxID=232270 RepID=UPI0003736FAD|nr:YhgE/Pip domain-containing protein [Effusibacillus pohliae]